MEQTKCTICLKSSDKEEITQYGNDNFCGEHLEFIKSKTEIPEKITKPKSKMSIERPKPENIIEHLPEKEKISAKDLMDSAKERKRMIQERKELLDTKDMSLKVKKVELKSEQTTQNENSNAEK